MVEEESHGILILLLFNRLLINVCCFLMDINIHILFSCQSGLYGDPSPARRLTPTRSAPPPPTTSPHSHSTPSRDHHLAATAPSAVTAFPEVGRPVTVFFEVGWPMSVFPEVGRHMSMFPEVDRPMSVFREVGRSVSLFPEVGRPVSV